MNRKILSRIILLSTSSLVLFACGNGEDTEDSSDPESVEPTDVEEDNDTEIEEEGITEDEDAENEASEANDETEIEEEDDDSLANMTDEERREHYLSMMVDPDAADEQVFEDLELRGVHENTIAYGGRVRPGATVELDIQDRRADIDSTDELEVNEDGFFALNLHQYENVEGDEIRLTINHEEFASPQEFILDMHGVAEGMEVITPLSDTSAYEEELLSSLDLEELPNFYPNTLVTTGYLGRHLEGFFYSIEGTEFSNAFMEFSQRDNDEGQINISLDEYPEAGQPITYYAIGDGVIATTEDTVEEMTPEAEQAAETIQNETDITIDESTSGETTFTTVPNAEVSMWNPEAEVRTTLSSDENGEVVMPRPEEYNESGTTLYVTIRDEEGYTDTIEVEF